MFGSDGALLGVLSPELGLGPGIIGFCYFDLVRGSFGYLPRLISLLMSKLSFFTRLSDADRSRIMVGDVSGHEPVGDPVRRRRIYFVSGPVRIRTVIITIPRIRLPTPSIMEWMRCVPVRVVPGHKQGRTHNDDWAVNVPVGASDIVSFDCIVDDGGVLDNGGVLYVDRYGLGNFVPVIIKVYGLFHARV